MYIFRQTCIYVHAYMLHICMHTYMCMYMFICIYVHKETGMGLYVCMCIDTHILDLNMSVSIYVHLCMYIGAI